MTRLATTFLSAVLLTSVGFAGELSKEQMSAVVVVNGDTGKGTGFVTLFQGKPVVVTNQHVLEGQKSLRMVNSSGVEVKGKKFVASKDRDIAMMLLDEVPEGIVPLELAENANEVAKPGDSVIAPGNSKGEGSILVTPGKLVAFGPDRVEFDNPVYQGNSGGPVIHEESGKVIGVVTELKLLELDKFAKASFDNKDSQIKSKVRYFGHRIDTSKGWESLDLEKFQKVTAELERSKHELESLYGYLTNSDNGEWRSFAALQEARVAAAEIINSGKYSDSSKTEAAIKFSRQLDAMCRNTVTRAEAKKGYYINNTRLEEVRSLHTNLVEGIGIAQKDPSLLRTLTLRGN